MPGLGWLSAAIAPKLEASREAKAVDHSGTIDQHQPAAVVYDWFVLIARAPADQGPPQLLAKVVQQVGGLLPALVLGVHGEHHFKAILDVLGNSVLRFVLPGFVIGCDHIGRGVL